MADYVLTLDTHATTLVVAADELSEYGGERIRVVQNTDCPVAETTSLRVSCNTYAAFAMKIRIPSWACEEQVIAHVDGQRKRVLLRLR